MKKDIIHYCDCCGCQLEKENEFKVRLYMLKGKDKLYFFCDNCIETVYLYKNQEEE